MVKSNPYMMMSEQRELRQQHEVEVVYLLLVALQPCR